MFLLYEGWPGRTGSGRSGGENECGVYVREGGQCVVCEFCVHGWVCALVGGGGSEDEKLAKVLMKESLCEALFCLESGSKLWKAIW